MTTLPLRLPPAARRRVRELALAAWPREACGLLEGPDASRVTAVVRCANLHDDPERRYTIDPEAFLRAEHTARVRGRAIVGTWHSHPHGDARPSATDIEQAWPGWSYLIAGVTNEGMRELRCWSIRQGQALERPLHPAAARSLARLR